MIMEHKPVHKTVLCDKVVKKTPLLIMTRREEKTERSHSNTWHNRKVNHAAVVLFLFTAKLLIY